MTTFAAVAVLLCFGVFACRHPAGVEPASAASWAAGSASAASSWGWRAKGVLQLTRYSGRGWRATFYPEGIAHSATAAVGSAWEREPRTAVQRAAWESLRKREADAA